MDVGLVNLDGLLVFVVNLDGWLYWNGLLTVLCNLDGCLCFGMFDNIFNGKLYISISYVSFLYLKCWQKYNKV